MICGVHPFVVMRKDVSFNTFEEVIATLSPGQPFTECFKIVARRVLERAEVLEL